MYHASAHLQNRGAAIPAWGLISEGVDRGDDHAAARMATTCPKSKTEDRGIILLEANDNGFNVFAFARA